jgi:hypothetical protein
MIMSWKNNDSSMDKESVKFDSKSDKKHGKKWLGVIMISVPTWFTS